jgi:uncharacterized protein YxjI
MRQKMAAIGDDFWIENDHGQDDVIILPVTVCIDEMAYIGR